jgi:predicted DsbA family dithiol-disulfide isomerase
MSIKAVVLRAAAVGLFAVFVLSPAMAAEKNPLHPSYEGKHYKEEMQRDFKAMDTNKDGMVSFEEWQAHTNPLHPEFARNHAKPGTPRLSKQEFDEVWQATANSKNVVTEEEYMSHSNPLHPEYERYHAKPGTPKN